MASFAGRLRSVSAALPPIDTQTLHFCITGPQISLGWKDQNAWDGLVMAVLVRMPRLLLLTCSLPITRLPLLRNLRHLVLTNLALTGLKPIVREMTFPLSGGLCSWNLPALQTLQLVLLGAEEGVPPPRLNLGGFSNLQKLGVRVRGRADIHAVPPGCDVFLGATMWHVLADGQPQSIAGRLKSACIWTALDDAGIARQAEPMRLLNQLSAVRELALCLQDESQYQARCHTFSVAAGSFPLTCRHLTSLDLHDSSLGGGLSVSLPPWLCLSKLRLVACKMQLVFEDPAAAAAALTALAVAYTHLRGPGPFVLLRYLFNRGLTLGCELRDKHPSSQHGIRNRVHPGVDMHTLIWLEDPKQPLQDKDVAVLDRPIASDSCTQWCSCGACWACLRASGQVEELLEV
jgi:hypothetical protein